MQQEINTSEIETIDGWTFRIQPPKIEGHNRLMLLIHGWTGDEQVMDLANLTYKATQQVGHNT